MLPGVVFLCLAFALPIVLMGIKSFTDPSAANYSDFVNSRPYTHSLLYTLEIALLVTAVCAVVGYPWAYLIHRAGSITRAVLIALVLVPFWSSLLVRTYAWTILLRPSGVINWVLMKLNLVDTPLTLVGNTFGVTVGMTQVLLPFMVLPTYAVMSRIDDDYLRAARGLGAKPRIVFSRIFFPLSRPGLLAGALLVFVLSVGFYITPAVLGSAAHPMFSQLIVTQANALLKFGYASALAVILLVVTVAAVFAGGRLVEIGQILGYEESSE